MKENSIEQIEKEIESHVNQHNVGLVSINAVVNTSNMLQTIKELDSRVKSHETVVATNTILKPVNNAIKQKVENGSFNTGDLLEMNIQVSTVDKDGNAVFISFSNN